MKKEIADRILALCDELAACADKVVSAAREIDDEEQRKTINRGVGEVIGAVVTHIQVPIYRLHPEFDPLKTQ